MPTITITTSKAGVLTNATSVTLSNAAGTAGITRNDTGAVVIADGTAFTNSATGTYTYVFTAPEVDVFYTATVETVASGSTTFREIIFYVSTSSASVIVPSAIISQYLISTVSLFSAVSAATTWPLFKTSLPDGRNINDDAAAVWDTSPELQSKQMDGDLVQRYGVQLMIRSKSYNDGWEKASIVHNAFQTVNRIDEVIGGTTFRINNISAGSGVVSLGTERTNKQRYLFSINILATIKEL